MRKSALIIGILCSVLILTGCDTSFSLHEPSSSLSSLASSNSSFYTNTQLISYNSSIISNISTSTSGDGKATLNTDQTDKTKLTRDYSGKSFDEDGIGIVTFRSCLDGDGANFKSGSQDIKIRFLGINTPESISITQPWGIPATNYVCNIIRDPSLILVAENDVPVFGKTDSSGLRHLAFLWYKPINASDTAFRLLNLEMVEQAFSYNLWGDKNSIVCPYKQAFEDAEYHARSTGARIYGEIDHTMPDDSVHQITLKKLRNEFDIYGKSDTSAGLQLRIRAIVVGMIGDNMVLRDLAPGADDEPDTPLAGIYAYAGYNSSLAETVSVGDVVFFYCKATKFNGVIQLSDVKASQIDRTFPFQVLAEDLTGPTEEYPFANIEPYEVDTSTFTKYSDFEKYNGVYIKTNITVRNAEIIDIDEDGQPVTFQSYFNIDSSKNYTLYANSFGYLSGGYNRLALNLRVDGSSYPYINADFFQVGKTYTCKGYLSPSFDRYQLHLFNNILGMNYVVAI